MIELGDLREGILGDDLVDFYRKVFKLKNIEIIGIGSNLNCLHGVMPSEDKLLQLVLYKKILELTFKTKIELVSGGTTVTLPLIKMNKLPRGINHFRIGEALFFGVDLFEDKRLEGMYADTFELVGNIIEVGHNKPSVPYGELKENPSGEKYKKTTSTTKSTSKHIRAIVDIGLLDINPKFLVAKNKRVKIIGASSDMLIIDISESRFKYTVGSTMSFRMSYMGALTLMNSHYIEKEIR